MKGRSSLEVNEFDGINGAIPTMNDPKLIYTLKVREEGVQKVLDIRLTDCIDVFFEGVIYKEQLIAHMQEILGMEDWDKYIKILKDAFAGKSKSILNIPTIENNSITLQITCEVNRYNIQSKNIIINGKSNFTETEKRSKIQGMVFDMFKLHREEKAKHENEIEELTKTLTLRKLLTKPLKKEKSKYKGNLINPKLKRKKEAIGARIHSDNT